MHIFGYVTNGFQSQSYCGIELASFLYVLVVYVPYWFRSEWTSAHAGGFCPANVETFAHVPTITVEHVFIYDVTLLKSGKNVFMYYR